MFNPRPSSPSSGAQDHGDDEDEDHDDDSDSDDGDVVTTAEFEKVMGSRRGKDTVQMIAATAAKEGRQDSYAAGLEGRAAAVGTGAAAAGKRSRGPFRGTRTQQVIALCEKGKGSCSVCA